MEEVRQLRYEQTVQLYSEDAFGTDESRSQLRTVNAEARRIFLLDRQYQGTRRDFDSELRVLDAALSSKEKGIEEMAQRVEELQKRLRLTTDSKDAVNEDDIATYRKASNIIHGRVEELKERLLALEETIASIEHPKVFDDPEAQELFVQLQALMSIQDKELGILENNAL